ncbi:MAG: class I SAM-dependent methyltransferase [Chloroflexi bacterium]|nr:class I SAM-dependent methyltransferase [Chloroflexota bacterium]
MKIDNSFFINYKKTSIQLFQDILYKNDRGGFDEQALPAYTNPNPLMRYLFWQRVKFSMEYISDLENCDLCMDFGCGFGVMIPFLMNKSTNIIAVDLDTSMLQEIGKEQKWTNVRYSQRIDDLTKYNGRVDLILAMDVLEHIQDINGTLESFKRLISPHGSILITGPTENLLYKIGRKIAHYSGDYHRTNIYNIADELSRFFTISHYKTLFPVIKFFEIYIAKIKI